MIYYGYSPSHDLTAIGYRNEEICRYLKEKGVARYSDLSVKFNKRTLAKHLNELIEKRIVSKTESGEYRLTKEVRVERSKHLFKQFTFDGTTSNNYIEWYDLEELPTDIRNGLIMPISCWLFLIKNDQLPTQVREKIFRLR